VTIRGTNKVNIGTYAHIFEEVNAGFTKKDYEYYVEGVTHNFTLFEGYVCELNLERGQPYKGGLFEDGFRGKFYFDENRTVDEVTWETYRKLAEEYNKTHEKDEKNIPITPEQARLKVK
jgi:hypothetical protein